MVNQYITSIIFLYSIVFFYYILYQTILKGHKCIDDFYELCGQWFIEATVQTKIDLTYKRSFSKVTSPFKDDIKIFGIFIY